MDPKPAPPELARGLPEEMVTPKRSVILHLARAGEAPVRIEDLADEDIVELEMQDGLRVWTHVQDLEPDFVLRRHATPPDGAIELPPTLSVSGGPSPWRRGANGRSRALRYSEPSRTSCASRSKPADARA
jgi:hypothetical protein